MRNLFRRLFRRRQADVRAALLRFQRADHEMVRVFLKGRKNRRAAVCFTGYPRVGNDSVTLFGEDKVPRATVRLRHIGAVQRVFTFRQGGKRR